MQPKGRVLIIHSNATIRQVLARGIARCGGETFQAQKRKDGFPLLYRAHPDLVLLQVGTEHEEGWQFFSDVRLVTDVPMILLAERELEPFQRMGLEEGNTIVRYPPFEIQAIIKVANRLWRDLDIRLAERVEEEASVSVRLGHLQSSEVLAIDQALQDVGELGEVRLIMQRGHLRFIKKLKVEPFPVCG